MRKPAGDQHNLCFGQQPIVITGYQPPPLEVAVVHSSKSAVNKAALTVWISHQADKIVLWCYDSCGHGRS